MYVISEMRCPRIHRNYLNISLYSNILSIFSFKFPTRLSIMESDLFLLNNELRHISVSRGPLFSKWFSTLEGEAYLNNV
jgi:hypothetical protein